MAKKKDLNKAEEPPVNADEKFAVKAEEAEARESEDGTNQESSGTVETTEPTENKAGATAEDGTTIQEQVEVVPTEEAEEESPSDPEEVITALKEELEQAQQEAAKNLENWQRTAAESANFKRRQEEQLKLQRDRIKAEVLQGVISALDDLDLGFQNLPEEIDGQLIGWVEGFRLVQRKLYKILDDQNVMPISTEGNFDPNFHEAVSYEESDDHETDEIIEELRKGYQIGNRTIRPALVRVAR